MAHKQNLASMMLAAAHKPIVHFPDVARGIAAVESRNVSACVDLRAKTPDRTKPDECNCSPGNFWTCDNEGFNAIACGDAAGLTYDPAWYGPCFEDLAASSPFAAPFWGVHHLQCTEWHVSPTWRYGGERDRASAARRLTAVRPGVPAQ